MVPGTTRDRTAPIPSPSTVASVALTLVVVTSVVGVLAAPAAGENTDGPRDGAPTGDRTGPPAGTAGSGGAATAGSTAVVTGLTGAADAGAAEAAANRCPDNLGGMACISGRFTYRGPDGNLHPARQVTVELVDDDVVNHEIETTRTDANGRFTFVFDPDEHAFWGSETTVFLNFYAENPAADGTKNELRITYEAESDSMDVSPGDAVGMGTFYPTKHNDVWRAVDWTLTARQEIARKTSGWSRDQVRIKHPATFVDGAKTISIPGFRYIALPAQSEYGWDRSTVYHEYGHAVMDAMYDYEPLDWPLEAAKEAGSCHVPSSESNPAYAWIEGWAEFVEAAVADDPNADGMVLESGNYYDRSDGNGDCMGADAGGAYDGASVEGSVASILWDVYDGTNDDGLDYTLGDIVRTIDGSDVQNVNDFWSDFVTHRNREALREIYYQNGIRKPDQYEGEESATNPHGLEANTTVAAQVNGGDDDHFAVDLESGETLTATLDDTGRDDLDVAVYGPDGDRLGLDAARNGGTVEVTADDAGTYEVVVSGAAGASAPYDLTVGTHTGGYGWVDPGLLPGVVVDADYLEWSFDGGAPTLDVNASNRSVGAGDLGCGGGAKRIEGSLSSAGDRAVHTVAVPDGCSVYVTLAGPEGSDYDLYLTMDGRTPSIGDYDRRSRSPTAAEAVELADSNTTGGTEVGILVTAYAGSGDYTITVRPAEED